MLPQARKTYNPEKENKNAKRGGNYNALLLTLHRNPGQVIYRNGDGRGIANGNGRTVNAHLPIPKINIAGRVLLDLAL
jgi:hypothetical protein